MKKIVVKKNQHKQITLDKPGEYLVVLAGAEAEAEISGAFKAAGAQELEVNVTIHHQAPHTKASTTLKGVADDQAFIKFVGKIIIDEGCGDSNSFLTERMLLLSDQARAEAIPELEILADDVKCSHAASITKIPESQIFYLMSRGLSRKQAQEAIVKGFLSPS